jgi:histidinol-phosphate/aromatic aminotransferase/cobyric acid decarboxylase-like protein
VIRCRVDRFALLRRDEYDVDLPRLKARLQRGYDLAVLVNPNSPTGRHACRDALANVLAAAPAKTRCWIDETYIDYVGSAQSLERFAADSTNIVVCKSMSKVYALSGVRAAYLCGPAAIIGELAAHNPPWAVSLPAQVAAVTALKDRDYYARQYDQTHRLRETLAGALRDQCDFDVVSGVANFLLCHLPGDGPDAGALVEACRRRSLFIRDASNMGRSFGRHCVRIAVKDAATNQRMLSILAHALRELRPQQKGAITP